MIKTWAGQDAKAHFSKLLNACIGDGPQVITRRGSEITVIVIISKWKRLNNAARPSLKTLLLSDLNRADFVLPKRGSAKRRSLPKI